MTTLWCSGRGIGASVCNSDVSGPAPLTIVVGCKIFMIGAILLSMSVVSGLTVWLLGIRRFLSQRGVAGITSATWGASAWADWQQCSEYARAKHDSKAARLSRAFLAAQIGCVAGIILMICGL